MEEASFRVSALPAVPSVSNSILMPISLRDWLPEEHFAWFVLEAVEQLDLSAFHAAYRDDG